MEDFFQQLKQDIKVWLPERLLKPLPFHNWAHTASVVEQVKLLGQTSHCSKEELLLLQIAALFHDTGFTELYNGHEEVSARIAMEYLAKSPLSIPQKEKVDLLIRATFLPHKPNDLLEALIRDADLNNLGSELYFNGVEALWEEWAFFFNDTTDRIEKIQQNITFLESHTYHTAAATIRYKTQKAHNINFMKALLSETKA